MSGSVTPSIRRISPILASVVWLLSYGAAPADAAVINVTTTADGGPGSLRAAFDTANANAEADEIVLQAGVTHELTICGGGAEEDANADGDLDHTAAEALTITGNGATLRNACVDERVIENITTGSLTVSNVTITGGDADGGGGAIQSVDGSVTITNGTFTSNNATEGGAIDTATSAITVSNSSFMGNSTDNSGGALETSTGAITVTASILSANVSGSTGGAIRMCCDASLNITDSTLSGNSAEGDGGAVETCCDMGIVIRGSVIDGNSAGTDGGGDGGGIRTNDASITLENSTISGNNAVAAGGMVSAAGTTTINNVTFQGNSATAGEGNALLIEDAEASVQLSNTILASTGPDACDGAGTFTSLGFNLSTDASCNLTATGDMPSTDPLLGPLADNGGPTQTHALLKGSPAIGGGNETIARGGPACEPTDQRGLPRKDCDIGAYELVLCGKAVVNRIGTEGNDVLTGTAGGEGMLGLGGKDRLSGKGGKDGLCGGPGKDKLRGGGGKDFLKGEGGKDTCIGQGGKDRARACEKERSIR